MEVREILKNIDAPNVSLKDIRPKSRFIDLIVRSGIETIYQLKNMSDDEILEIPLMGKKKLAYLKDYFQQWADDGFEAANHVNILEPETIERGLREKVFRNDKNLQIIYYRAIGRTYEDVGGYFKMTRQGVNETEKAATQRFERWYKENNLSDRIGNMNDFYIYCKKFGDDVLVQTSQYIARTASKNNEQLPKKELLMPNGIF